MKPSFMFFNMWVDHEDFSSLVEGNWAVPIQGTKQFTLCQKLKMLTRGLKELNRNHFAHISAKAEVARSNLKQAQTELHDRPRDKELKREVRNLQAKAVFLIDAERKFLAQKTKCEFLLQGDKSLHLFHSLFKRNAKRNFIASLIKEDGTTTSMKELQGELLKFYSNLMGTWCDTDEFDEVCMNSRSKLSSAQAASLVDSFTNEDIKGALFDIGNEKSLGLDGYTSYFFKKVWNLVGDDLCAVVLEFLTLGNCLDKRTTRSLLSFLRYRRLSQMRILDRFRAVMFSIKL